MDSQIPTGTGQLWTAITHDMGRMIGSAFSQMESELVKILNDPEKIKTLMEQAYGIKNDSDDCSGVST
jgi:hypothetical protein